MPASGVTFGKKTLRDLTVERGMPVVLRVAAVEEGGAGQQLGRRHDALPAAAVEAHPEHQTGTGTGASTRSASSTSRFA